ncbi:hypothetical protein BLA28_12325 [Eisenbergiella tayi]|nr:hypothetical protein BLA28_12325 [Eisenbergiella tayi]
MRYKIDVPVKEQPITLISGITFAQVPYWFPFYNYKDLKMDLLAPSGSSGQGKRPLFVWICGGGFATMERSAYIPWLTYFAKRGYIAASIEYRLSNSAHFPAQIEDVKKAIRFLRAHADEYGIDPDRVAVGGESAGGNLASMVGVTNDIAAFDVGEYPEQSSHVSAVVNFYGPAVLVKEPGKRSMDGIPLPDTAGYSRTIQLLGFDPEAEPERAAKTAAQYYINENTVPFFLAHGTGDTLVDISGSDEFYRKLSQNHVPVEYYRIQGAAHMGMEFYQDEMSQRVLEFLNKTL